jgi:hypothetical protein
MKGVANCYAYTVLEGNLIIFYLTTTTGLLRHLLDRAPEPPTPHLQTELSRSLRRQTDAKGLVGQSLEVRLLHRR